MARSCYQGRPAGGPARCDHAAQTGRLRHAARGRAAGLDRRHDGRAAQRGGGGPGEEVHGEVRGGEMRRWVLVLAVALFSGAAAAHELTMAEMEVRQISHGEFVWQWTASGSSPASQELKPVWPEGCNSDDINF